MAQEDFYLCDGDLEMLASTLLAAGARLVPALHYPSPNYHEIRSWQDLEPLVRQSRNILLFALSDAWQRAPLQVDSFSRDGRKVFYICQKNGGPAIDIALNRPITADGTPLIGQGHIAYYPRFWNPITEAMEVPNDELKKCYKELRTLLKKDAAIVNYGSRKYILTARSKKLGWPLAHIDVKLP